MGIGHGGKPARLPLVGALLAMGLLASACGGGAKRCLQLKLLDGQARQPSNIILYFSVETCDGDPVPGLAAEDFVIEEDTQPVSVLEAHQSIAPRSVAFDRRR